ncbi:MAG: FtsZ-interacting cell division protein ZipA [Polaribacter sp.]|jgi:FtsZ-interacting cell division protein ZipA
MDWQIRITLIIFGIVLVAYIYFDYSKKKKTLKDNDKLKKQFGKLSTGVDRTGFDSDGVGKPRTKNHSDISDLAEKIEPELGDLNISEGEVAALKVDENPEIKSIEPKVHSLIIQANESNLYTGNDFMPLFLSQGFKFGEMNIFHRYKNMGKKTGEPTVSLANALNPGTFDLQNIDTFTTPAFAIFSTFSGNEEYLINYKNLVKTAEFLVNELGGKLLDTSGNLYTREIHQYRLDEITVMVNDVATN